MSNVKLEISSLSAICTCIHKVYLAPINSLLKNATGFIILGHFALVITKLAQSVGSKRNINYALPHNFNRTLVIVSLWVKVQKLMISSDCFHDFSLSWGRLNINDWKLRHCSQYMDSANEIHCQNFTHLSWQTQLQCEVDLVLLGLYVPQTI